MTNFTLADLVNTQGSGIWTMLGLRIDSGDVEGEDEKDEIIRTFWVNLMETPPNRDCDADYSYLDIPSKDIAGFNQHSDICSDCDHR
jgi:hypothetical protein